MPSYKLVYFDLRGKGEIVRLTFHAAGIKFDDFRIPRSDWPGHYKAETPFGQVPYLEIDGKKVPQSFAIARYIARENGLYGDNTLESFAIDELIGLGDDYRTKWMTARRHPEGKKKKELQRTLINEELPAFLNSLEKILLANGTTYYVGNRLSLADLAVCEVLESSYMTNPEVFSKYYRNILVNRRLVHTNPRLQSYISKRKVSPI